MNKKNIKWFRLFTLLVCLVLTQATNAQSLKTSIFQHLTPQEGAKMTLTLDMTTLAAMRQSNDYFPAALTDHTGKIYKVEARVRGRFRRKTCEIPPLKLKFSKKEIRNLGFDTLNEVKLVLPCFDNPESDQWIVREYLTYRMFEQLSPISVRARLIRLTLEDTHVNRKNQVLAILVEHPEETEKRLGGEILDAFGLPTDSLVTNQAALVSMFEYMIGNTDWDISMQRNVLLLRNHSGRVFVIPYDFDFAGSVSASYASPSTESGLSSIRERYLMATGISTESLKRATQVMRHSKSQLLDLCYSKYLDSGHAVDMYRYISSFFIMIEERGTAPSVMPAPDMD
jgi:hypothetical protein